MFRKALAVMIVLLLFTSCKEETNELKIYFPRSDQKSTAGVKIFGLQVNSQDSILFTSRIPRNFSTTDTLKFENLLDGDYEIRFYDLLGNLKIKKIELENQDKKLIAVVSDSIDIRNFLSKTPINNLLDKESYTVETKGGCVASMYSFYKISKIQGHIYFESVNIPKRVLTAPEIAAVKKFEAELLAINGVDICMSTARMTYKILKDKDAITIVDNTCNWSGWETMMAKIYTDVN